MKNFLKTVLASLVALFIFTVLFLVFLGGLIGTQEIAPRVEKKTLLTLDLQVPISDRQPRQKFADVLDAALQERAQGRQTLREVVTAIDSATKDQRISGLFIKGNVTREGYYSGWAALKEVREAIDRFRKAGKPVITWQENLDEATLYVVSPAEKIVLHPLGLMEFSGLAAEVIYFKDAFEKYGIQVQVTRVGKYKSAVEPFMRSHMSEENREQLEALLGDLFQEALTAIARSRNLSPGDLLALSRDRGALTAPEAFEAGYVTAVGHYDQVLEELRELTGTKPGKPIERQLSVGEYFAATQKRASGKDKVVVIYAEGMILSGNDEDEVGGDYLARLLRKAREDDQVKAVVLRVNSPGGSASASDVIQRETLLLKREKPFVVSLGTVAASGGYWISVYGDELWAEPNTITGSIGVFGLFLSLKELMNEHGLNVDVVRTSPFADIYSIFRPKTEKELALVQRIVDRIYGQFLDKVAEGRKLDRQRVHEIAQGRVWSGKEAQKLGLVDHIGGLKQAIAAAARRAELGDTYAIEEYQRAEELMEVLLKELGMLPEENDDAQSPDMSLLWQRLQGLLHYTDRQGVYARMPFDLTIH